MRKVACLSHGDLNLYNILVDREGKITAVVGCGCVSALPIWTTTKMPKFLAAEIGEQNPKQSGYADEITWNLQLQRSTVTQTT